MGTYYIPWVYTVGTDYIPWVVSIRKKSEKSLMLKKHNNSYISIHYGASLNKDNLLISEDTIHGVVVIVVV